MAAVGQTRGFATEQQLKTRIKSVVNIEKITKAMKMVAAAKLRGAQANLDVAKQFVVGIDRAWGEETNKITTSKPLIVGMSSDKGLCGGVHSVIMKGNGPLFFNPSYPQLCISAQCLTCFSLSLCVCNRNPHQRRQVDQRGQGLRSHLVR